MTSTLTSATGDLFPPTWHDAARTGPVNGAGHVGDPVGLFHTWWRGDPLPSLPRRPALTIAPTDDVGLLANLTAADEGTLQERLDRGHRPWLARIANEPAGWGWVATVEASIPELARALAIPPANRYLWDFMTLPRWRRRGVYPALLQAILTGEAEAQRFWIGHDLANRASARGIAKAGFRPVGSVYRLTNGDLAMVPIGPFDRATAASALFKIPLPRC